MARRKILPRKEASRYDSTSFISYSSDDVPFNDLKTIVMSGSAVIDMPTGLPVQFVTDSAAKGRFKAADTLTSLIQTEVSGVYITGSVKAGLFDRLLRIDPSHSSTLEPFKEASLFEQGNFDVPFFASGSLPEIGNGTFDSELKNKAKINLSFSINSQTAMLAKTSSIYYLNIANGTWELPQNGADFNGGPFQKSGVEWYRASLPYNSKGSFFIEDQVGFDAYGNCLALGSLNRFRNAYPEYSHSNRLLGKIYDPSIHQQEFSSLITDEDSKSFQRNSLYDATQNQLFSLPIDRPFLIEKIVYEIPFCFGNDWFLDRTTAFPITASAADYINTSTGTGWAVSSLYDEGGPGITISLLSQLPYGTSSIRDLISHDLVTHVDDAGTRLGIYTMNSGSGSDFFYAVNVGVGAYTTPAGIVSGTTNGTKMSYTGSVIVRSEAAVSNGIKLLPEYGQYLDGANADNKFKSIFSLKNFDTDHRLTGYNPFGRGMTGFSPSGGSIFGGEYVLPQRQFAFSNYYYESGSSTKYKEYASYPDVGPLLVEKPGYDVYLLMNQLFMEKKQAPYLVYPGQKLMIAASKTRPIFKNIKLRTNNANATLAIASLISSSYYYTSPAGHDVQFNTGSLNVTIYGSYVKADGAYLP